MGWTVEQNTGANDYVIRCVFFNGSIYAFTRDAGVWRRDGVGPWTQVFAGGGHGWYWEDDDALYCPGATGNLIYRSTDGTTWVLDQNLDTLGSGQVSFNPLETILGGYGNYLYAANHDVTGPGRTYFYRRDLFGTWTNFGTAHVGTEGLSGRGIIGFGGVVYWITATTARYWDGAAWSLEPTLDGNIGSAGYMSIINNRLYVGSSSSLSLTRRYYWRTTSVSGWSTLNLVVPDNTWSTWPICRGGDGEDYTFTSGQGDGSGDGRIYQLNGTFSLIGSEARLWLGSQGGVGVEADGTMYIGTRYGGTVRFFRYDADYSIAASGSGHADQAMDVDGNGDILYLGLYDGSGNPILVTADLPLDGVTSQGSKRYDQGAGDAINVQAHYEVGNFSIIAGHFGNNEQAERSEDGGMNYSDIDPGTWAANRAQPIAIDPNDEEHVLLALDALDDLVEKDSDDAWTTLDAALPFDVGAMAIFDLDPNEIVIGRTNAGAVMIQYSPNNGTDWQDITGTLPVTDGIASIELV